MQEIINTWVVEPLSSVPEHFSDYLPTLLFAIIVFIVGIIVARILAIIAKRVFLALRIEKIAGRIGFTTLTKGDIKHSVAELIGSVTWWIVFIIVLDICFGIMGLSVLAELLQYIIVFLPKILVALGIVFIGYLLGMFIGGLVRIKVTRLEGINASFVGNGTKYGIWGISVIMALEKIGFLSSFAISILVISFGAIMLTFAIAFGLAFQHTALRLLDRWVVLLTTLGQEDKGSGVDSETDKDVAFKSKKAHREGE